MHREKKEENVTNLINWLHQGAPLRSRGKTTDDGNGGQRDCGGRESYHTRTDQHANDTSIANDKIRKSSRFLPYMSRVNQRWEIVRLNRRSRKGLRAPHQSNDCKRADGTTCGNCKKNYHRSLHNDKRNEPMQSSLSHDATIFGSQGTPPEVENRSIQGRDGEQTQDVKSVLGICTVQKVKIRDSGTTYLPCWILAQTRAFYPNELRNGLEYLVLKRTSH